MWLDFQDSEVACIEVDGGSLRLRFAAASVTQHGEAGYLPGLEIHIGQARWSGELAECVGRIAGGRLIAQGTTSMRLPLPYSLDGPSTLELAFANRSQLSVTSMSLACRVDGDAPFAPSLAC
jgi:hypothetical protein